MAPLPADMPPVLASTHIAVHAPISAGPAPLLAHRSSEDYTVEPGDTVYVVAAEHDTTVADIVSVNALSDGGRWIMSGQRLQLSGQPNASAARTTRPSLSKHTSPTAGATTTVTVRPGDTLSGIATKHKISVASLTRANKISNTRLIYSGQRLVIDGSSASTSATSTHSAPTQGRPTTVTVRSGDTLSSIADTYSVSLQDVQSSNPQLDAGRLWVGAGVRLPGGATSTGSSTASSTASEHPSPPGSSRTRAYAPDDIGEYLRDSDVDDTFLHYTYSSPVARSAEANRQHLASVSVPSTSETRSMIVATARRHGVDPTLMLALSSHESGWNQRAVSPANAIGIMQVIPTSGEWASSLIGRRLNLLDPQDNVTAGTIIMRALQRSADSEDDAIGGYYQGLGSINKNGPFPDTVSYVSSITSLRARL